MSQKYPPLPSVMRPVSWALRSSGVVIGAASLILGFLLAKRGSWSSAALVVVLGGSFVALTRLHLLSLWMPVVLAGLAIPIAIVIDNWLVALIMLATAAWNVWARRRPIGPGRARRISETLEVAEPEAIMRNAEGFVHEFTDHGFVQVGAVRAKIGRIEIIESLLLSEDSRSYASVTDSVIHITSLFSDGRTLATRNSGITPLSPDVFVNGAQGALPGELIESHAQALGTLAHYDHIPVALVEPELPQVAIEDELAHVAWMESNSDEAKRRANDVPLSSVLGVEARIADWHSGGADSSTSS